MGTALVHLVWAPLGTAPLRTFLDSYRAHEAGREHELVLVYNGFAATGDAEAHEALAAEVPHRAIALDAPVQDLSAYLAAARALEHQVLCLANSYAEVLAPGWLEALAGPAARPEVGLVGATGTYESHVTGAGTGGNPLDPLRPARRWVARRRMRRAFDPFPNPHVRTSCFAIRRELLLSLDPGPLPDKLAAHTFESGRTGLSRRVADQGLALLVAGRDGSASPQERWPESRTFRSGEQEQLLVADRRTQEYAEAPPERRRALAELAWGDRAVSA